VTWASIVELVEHLGQGVDHGVVGGTAGLVRAAGSSKALSGNV
jgi:hypothetical protein